MDTLEQNLINRSCMYLVIALQDARYGIINDQQRHVFGLLFDEVDKDKNGSVTLEELKLRMQPSVSRHDIKHFVQVNCFESSYQVSYLFSVSLNCSLFFHV